MRSVTRVPIIRVYEKQTKYVTIFNDYNKRVYLYNRYTSITLRPKINLKYFQTNYIFVTAA